MVFEVLLYFITGILKFFEPNNTFTLNTKVNFGCLCDFVRPSHTILILHSIPKGHGAWLYVCL